MNKLWPIRRNYKSAEQFILEQNIMFHNWLLAHLLKTESRDMLFGWTRRSIDFVPEWIALFQIGLKVNTNWKWSVWWLILGGQLCKKLEKRGKSEKFSNLTWRWYKMWQVVPPPIRHHWTFLLFRWLEMLDSRYISVILTQICFASGNFIGNSKIRDIPVNW